MALVDAWLLFWTGLFLRWIIGEFYFTGRDHRASCAWVNSWRAIPPPSSLALSNRVVIDLPAGVGPTGGLHSHQSGPASAPRSDGEVIPYLSKLDKPNPSGVTSSPIPRYIIFLFAVIAKKLMYYERVLQGKPVKVEADALLGHFTAPGACRRCAAVARTTGCYGASKLTRCICGGASNVIFQRRSERAILIHEAGSGASCLVCLYAPAWVLVLYLNKQSLPVWLL